MKTAIRPVKSEDLDAVTRILLEDARRKASLDPRLWPLAADARERIAAEFSKNVKREGSVRWLVADAGGSLVAVARVGVIPAPPIYHLAGRLVSLLFEETCSSPNAPDDTWPMLIAAAERESEAMGAVAYLAACAPAQHDKLRALETTRYAIVTHYYAKHGRAGESGSSSVRPAAQPDVPGIVALGAQSQHALFQANARMWEPHPEAPARFGGWMQHSLTLPDRRIFVAGEREVTGFIIAQPASPFHLPLTTDSSHLGLVDDFWAEEFAATSHEAASTIASDLLAEAEAELARRGRTSAMVIAPAARQAKPEFLNAHGYRIANAWMLKS